MLKRPLRFQRSAMVLCTIVLSVFLAIKCVDKERVEDGVITNAEGQQFAGSAACASCHKDVYVAHVRTAHYLTSRPAVAEYIKGSFEAGSNAFAFNRSVVVAMEKREDGFYQVEYFRDEQKKARRMDMVIGSGTMGQSFLNWRDGKLFQLPITYFSAAHTWSNSPGFPDKVVFNRIITSRCMECHATYMQTTSPPEHEPETFDRQQIIYGVDCERCHGPAAQHVAFQTQNPKETKGKYIINPAHFTRQQSLDLCALCHGGRLQKTKPSFSFVAGDTLSNYFLVDTTAPDPDKIDVHGNQYGLLRASKCFQLSQMTCNSCHNTHTAEKGNMAVFSQRCMNCHTKAHNNFCPMEKTMGAAITANCVDCHMPVKPSKAIAVFLPGASSPTSALIRSHHIAVYPDEAKRLMPLILKVHQDRKGQ